MKRTLYTTLVRAKAALRGDQPPPLTPLSEEALKYCDPAFTPGMGVLEEDPDKGIRCPLRGCGRWTHALPSHMRSHKEIELNGILAHRRLIEILSLDPQAPLWSSSLRANTAAMAGQTRRVKRLYHTLWQARDVLTGEERARLKSWKIKWGFDSYADSLEVDTWRAAQSEFLAFCSKAIERHQLRKPETLERRKATARVRAKRAVDLHTRQERLRILHETRSASIASAGLRNILNLCDAQLASRVLSVRDRVRRWPGIKDVMEYDPKLLGAMALLDWEWDHVLAWVRIKIGGQKDRGRSDVLLLLGAWKAKHGRLPKESELLDSTPLLPKKRTILAAMGKDSFSGAMRIAEMVL